MPKRESRVRYRIRWRRIFVLALLFFVTVTALTGAKLYLYSNYFYTYHPSQTATSNATLKTDEKLQNRVNVLLLGVDDPDPEIPGSTARRSDTMIVASINPKENTVNLVSIPRDTRVSIPGHSGQEKITHSYAYGGAGLAAKTVENLLGVPIHYYTAVDWQGFIKVIDILGGVDLYVEQNMKYEDPYANLTIELSKGYQHLDGEKAGQYVRFRHDELGDIGRVQRQQRFLKALSEEMLRVETIPKVPSIISTVNQHVTTDMNIFTLLKLANTVISMQSDSVQTEMLPGDFADFDGVSYWVPNQKETNKLVRRLLTDRSSVTVGSVSADTGSAAVN